MYTLSLIAILAILVWGAWVVFNKGAAWCKEQLDTGGMGYEAQRLTQLQAARHPFYKYILKGHIIKCDVCHINPSIRKDKLGNNLCAQC